MADMSIYVGGVLIPKIGSIEKSIVVNGTDVRTAGGSTYTDYINMNREWTIRYSNMLYSDYQIWETLFFRQSREQYLYMNFPSENVYMPVRISMSLIPMAYNKVLVPSFEVKLIERWAIS